MCATSNIGTTTSFVTEPDGWPYGDKKAGPEQKRGNHILSDQHDLGICFSQLSVLSREVSLLYKKRT